MPINQTVCVGPSSSLSSPCRSENAPLISLFSFVPVLSSLLYFTLGYPIHPPTPVQEAGWRLGDPPPPASYVRFSQPSLARGAVVEFLSSTGRRVEPARRRVELRAPHSKLPAAAPLPCRLHPQNGFLWVSSFSSVFCPVTSQHSCAAHGSPTERAGAQPPFLGVWEPAPQPGVQGATRVHAQGGEF